MKDKAARDAQEAYDAWAREVTAYRYVEVSLKNRRKGVDGGWAGNFVVNGRECFMVQLLPPRRVGDGLWKVVCSGNDDYSMERMFSREEDARRVYEGINPFTERKTLLSRGFRTT